MKAAEQKKYDGFKVWNDFFDREEIMEMERVPIHGSAYVVMLFRLYDMSISTGGAINIKNEQMPDGYIGYLTNICKSDRQFMDRAMSHYLQHGLVRVDDNGKDVKIHFPYVEENLTTDGD